MTTATEEKTRKRAKPKEEDVDLEQKEFAGMESPKIPAITRAARAYERAKKDRMKALEMEVSRKEKLIDLMKEHELNDYRDRDVEVSLEHTEKDSIKVKTAVDEDDADE